MEKQASNKIKVFLVSVLLVVGLMSGTARADHDHSDNLIAPLAGFLILGALLNHNHHYYRSNRHYGHYGHRARNHGYRARNHGHRARNYGHRARNYSSEGYSRRSKRINRH